MMVEANIISKMQVREAMLSAENNILHTDGTRYNFKEVGSFQVNTSEGAFTLGIEDMFSGEASSYFETFKGILTELSGLVVPDDQVDDDVRKMLFNFKGLMTDRCSVNNSFFQDFKQWRTEVFPFLVDNFNVLPEEEKEKVSRMHHVFCGLHVLHNLGIYAEKAISEWEKITLTNPAAHGGFSTNNSRTYDLLFELSKLTSVSHGDQRNGKAEEWRGFLKKGAGVKDYMVSFLHHRFNIWFVLGGAVYFHRIHLKDFVDHLEGQNFLHSSIKGDIENVTYLAAFRALGIFNKLITGPLFRKVEESGHIFQLNSMWTLLHEKLVEYSVNSTSLMDGETMFDDYLVTRDDVYAELFRATGDVEVDCLTQECLELICCTCSLMVRSQLTDQLPGGKYHQPSADILEETANCQRTNVLSERDFAQYDRMLSMKPTLSTVATCGIIMFSNNKTSAWLGGKSEGELQDIISIAMKNKIYFIEKYKQRKNAILAYRTDMLEKKKLENDIKEQRAIDERELLTQQLTECGGLWSSEERVVQMVEGMGSEKDIIAALRIQIKYRKKVLAQKFTDKKLGQISESDENGKYVSYSLRTLREHLSSIIEFSSVTSECRADILHSNIRKNDERKVLLEKAKKSMENEKIVKEDVPKKIGLKRNKVPVFFGKVIRHKYEEDGKDIWYRGIVVSCLDVDEFDDSCEFEVVYDGSDEKNIVQLVEEYKKGWVVVEGKSKKQKTV